jgi:putative FmdB family regulatory protein
MPTYEYVCTSCENHWEEVQKISEPALDTCPKCTNKTAKRQISGGNFILKGGGWYADLYSSPSAKANKDDSAKAEKTDTKSGGEKSEKSADAKPNGATPAKSSPPPAKTESSSSSSSSSSTPSTGGSKT